VLVTHLHSDHVGGLTTQDGKRVFPHADVYVAKAESDFWLSPAIAAKASLVTRLAREDVLIAGPHMNVPALGRVRKEGSEYSWAPVVFTDQWDKRAP
jgi:glyoxylase-like metal-dependent hydrolase (beta-lactamase superfamily II)